MAENISAEPFERKIFFLYPSVLIQNKICEELAQKEFEVYSAQDEIKLRQVLKKYPNSIVLANISEGMKESAWEAWIKSVMEDSETAGIDIGIIAYGENAELRHKYLEQLKIRCGYTVMKTDVSAVAKQLENILDSANAKSRRKYIRVQVDNCTDITVCFRINGTIINGVIKVLSTAAFSCSFSCCFPEDPDLSNGTHFSDIEIKLPTETLKVQGMVLGSRIQETEKLYVILISQHTSSEVQKKIRKYIRSLLLARMDIEFNG